MVTDKISNLLDQYFDLGVESGWEGNSEVAARAEEVRRKIEAALSTGAEPVAYRGTLAGGGYVFTPSAAMASAWSEGVLIEPLYTAPPAPSVAVKALKDAEEELSRIDCIPMVTETKDPYAQLELAKVYAGRGAHEARKALSALSAQVQE